MSRTLRTTLCLLFSVLLVAAGQLVLVGSSSADIGYSQQVKIKDETPEVGRREITYKNYSEKMKLCQEDGYCEFLGYKKSEGELQVKLSTFRILDGRKKVDYYLVDVDVINADRSGRSDNGWFKATVDHGNARVVDVTNTTSSYYDDDRDCRAISVGLSTPWPIVSASVDLGTVTFCEEGASYTMAPSGTASVYSANNLRQISHVASERVLKVRAGDKPRFTVVLTYPVDKCTKAGGGLADGNCVAYTNGTATKKLRIGTKG